MIGQTLGHYRITGTLGKGDMGEVHRPEDERLGNAMALRMCWNELGNPAGRG